VMGDAALAFAARNSGDRPADVMKDDSRSASKKNASQI